MSTKKIIDILQKLKTLTQAGKIEWETTEKSNVFQTSFPEFSIRIGQRPTKAPDAPPDEVDYIISLYNQGGVMVENMSDLDLTRMYREAYSDMKEIYDSARGYALGTEQTLDTIIATLDQEDN